MRKRKATTISVQGWGSWFGDQAKAWPLTLVIGSLVLLLFNWIVRRWPRRYWFGIWLATLPLLVFSIFISPLPGAHLQQIRAALKESRAAGGQA